MVFRDNCTAMFHLISEDAFQRKPVMPARQIAVIIESSTQFGRNLLRGIARFGQLHHWHIHYEQGGLDRVEPEWLHRWHGDGVICRARDLSASTRLAREGVAVVACLNHVELYCPADVPDTDNVAIGRMAAEYFLRKGFRNFAFIGFSDCRFSDAREASFAESVLAAGMQEPLRFHTQMMCSGPTDELRQHEAAFLLALPAPCAVLCATDERAAQILGRCHGLGRLVPEQLSILGVDDDPLLCQLSHPALSSIDTNAVEIGYSMAARLEALMNGESPGPAPRVAPRGVVERGSTSMDAIDDPHLVKALSFIRNHAHSVIRVEDVAKASGLSRRSLEQRFGTVLHASVGAHIRHRLIDSIKNLLMQTDHSIEKICEISGIEHPQRLFDLFRREVGVSPAKFRKLHQVKSAENR